MNDLVLLLDLFGNSEETKLLICTAIFVWCLQRHRNGGVNSGQKSAIIVTDAYMQMFDSVLQISQTTLNLRYILQIPVHRKKTRMLYIFSTVRIK